MVPFETEPPRKLGYFLRISGLERVCMANGANSNFKDEPFSAFMLIFFRSFLFFFSILHVRQLWQQWHPCCAHLEWTIYLFFSAPNRVSSVEQSLSVLIYCCSVTRTCLTLFLSLCASVSVCVSHHYQGYFPFAFLPFILFFFVQLFVHAYAILSHTQFSVHKRD